MLACERCHGESVWKPAKALAMRSSTTTTRKDAAMPLLGSHKDVACAKCHAKSVFNLPFPKPDAAATPAATRARTTAICSASATASGATHRRSRRSSSRTSITPRRPSSTSVPRTARSSVTTATPRRSARASRTGACELCHAKDSHHGDRFKRVRRPAEVRTCHPSGGPKFTPSAFNHAREHEVQARRSSTPTVRAARVTAASSPSDFEDFTTSIDGTARSSAWAATSTRRSTRTTKHPNGKYTNDAVPELPHAPRRSDDPTARTTR